MADYSQPRRFVDDAHRCSDFINVLATMAAGMEDVDTEVIGVDF